MPQQPHPTAAITVTCPLCSQAQTLDPNRLQDLQVVTSEPAQLQSITARLTCTSCGRDFVIALQAKPEAQAAPV